MLADTAVIEKIAFPVLASPKLDGIRCLVIDGKCVSRNFKPIANHHIRNQIEAHLPSGVDGEIIAGVTFQDTSSSVASRDGSPDFIYYVFDYVSTSLHEPYQERMRLLEQLPLDHVPYVVKVLPDRINTYDELLQYEDKCLNSGYEGVMIRSLAGPYKCGRSTVKEGYLLKIKRFTDAEAVVIGMEEQMHNQNELEQDAFGYAKRASCKDGKVPAGTLGNLLVRDVVTGVEFSIGTGFDAALRKQIWENQYTYVGKLVKYKSQKSGEKDLPRFPVFLGFRDINDMDAS